MRNCPRQYPHSAEERWKLSRHSHAATVAMGSLLTLMPFESEERIAELAWAQADALFPDQAASR